MPLHSCCFTGHRPTRFHWGYNEEHPDCINLKLLLKGEIKKCIANGITTFISGMAQGVDQWAATAVLELKEDFPNIRLCCALPCPQQASHWTSEAKQRYKDILSKADTIIYVSETYHKNCMYRRNRWMVDHGDMVLAVYDGTPRSGTGATVHYAEKQGKTVCLLHPDTLLRHTNPIPLV